MRFLGFGVIFAGLALVATVIAMSRDREQSPNLPPLRFERGALLDPVPQSPASEGYKPGQVPADVKALLDQVPHINAVDPVTVFPDGVVVLIVNPHTLDRLPNDLFARQPRDGRVIVGINIPLETLTEHTGFASIFPVSATQRSAVFTNGYAEPFYTFVTTCGNSRGMGQSRSPRAYSLPTHEGSWNAHEMVPGASGKYLYSGHNKSDNMHRVVEDTANR